MPLGCNDTPQVHIRGDDVWGIAAGRSYHCAGFLHDAPQRRSSRKPCTAERQPAPYAPHPPCGRLTPCMRAVWRFAWELAFGLSFPAWVAFGPMARALPSHPYVCASGSVSWTPSPRQCDAIASRYLVSCFVVIARVTAKSNGTAIYSSLVSYGSGRIRLS